MPAPRPLQGCLLAVHVWGDPSALLRMWLVDVFLRFSCLFTLSITYLEAQMCFNLMTSLVFSRCFRFWCLSLGAACSPGSRVDPCVSFCDIQPLYLRSLSSFELIFAHGVR